MKICFISATRPHAGGIINYLNNFSQAAKELGHFADIISIFETSKQRKTMPQFDKKIGNLLVNRDWLSFLTIQLIKIIIFSRFLKNYLVKKYDFIYVTDIISYNAIGPLEKLFKIPVILNPIDSVSSVLVSKKMARPDGWLYHYLLKQEKKAYLGAKALLSSGTDISTYCQKLTEKNIKLPVIDNPIDEKKFYVDIEAGQAMREKLGLQNKFIVLYIGRISPDKGTIYLLKAIPEILKKEPEANIQIVIGGAPGPEKDNLINYIKNNHYENYAKFLGYIEDEDICTIYNMADVFCAPSVIFSGETTNYLNEGKKRKIKEEYTISTTPTTAPEAMACGKPVICTAISGSKETIRENIDGILVPEKNPLAIAEAILRLKNNPRLKQKMGEAALESFRNRYLSTKIFENLLSYYREKFNR